MNFPRNNEQSIIVVMIFVKRVQQPNGVHSTFGCFLKSQIDKTVRKTKQNRVVPTR